MNETNNIDKRAAPLIAFGALIAFTAAAGIACSIRSIFVGCIGSSRNRDDIDYALEKIEQIDYQWIEMKNDIKYEVFIVAT